MAVEIRPKQSSLTVKVDRNDHEGLTKRNNPNQHSIEAITGLTEALERLENFIKDLQVNGSSEAIELLTIRLNEAIKQEEARAKEEEEKIRAELIGLGDEISERVNEAQALRQDFIDEIERVKNVEHELRTIATEERTRAQAAEEELATDILAERDRAIKEASDLLEIIDVERQRAIREEARVEGKIVNKADLVNGIIPNSQLPTSFRDISVIEEKTQYDFPETGTAGSLYISTDTNIIYRWDGEKYVELSSAKFKDDSTVFIKCEV